MNDNYGHEKGDELIKLTAQGLENSFGHIGRCYRMGGDEFLVILTGPNPTSDYNSGIQLLQNYCDTLNQSSIMPFTVEIAHGFVLNKGKDVTLESEDAIKEADHKMYINKRELKQQDQ